MPSNDEGDQAQQLPTTKMSSGGIENEDGGGVSLPPGMVGAMLTYGAGDVAEDDAGPRVRRGDEVRFRVCAWYSGILRGEARTVIGCVFVLIMLI